MGKVNFYIVQVYHEEVGENGYLPPGIFFNTWDETTNFVSHCIHQGLCVSVQADQEEEED